MRHRVGRSSSAAPQVGEAAARAHAAIERWVVEHCTLPDEGDGGGVEPGGSVGSSIGPGG